MPRLITLSISERAWDILHAFPWGTKSKLISEYIETLDTTPNQIMNNPELPTLQPKNGKLRTKNSLNGKNKHAPSPQSLKQESEQLKQYKKEEATATQTSNQSEQNILKLLKQSSQSSV